MNRLGALTELCTSISPLTLKRRIDRHLASLPAALGAQVSA
ncbi:MAG: hypothetical protein ACREN1_00480 [Candidatus Dormibacteria bacterium]